MFYNDKELTTKEDCLLLLNEIEAYRSLENEEFNFNGIILKNDNEYNLGSEDAYYEMDIQNLEDILDYWDDYNSCSCSYRSKNNKNNNKSKCNKRINNNKLNRYEKKLINKRKLKELSKYNSTSIYYHENENYYQRYYLSSVRSYNKYYSKKIRYRNDFALKGNSYRKVYNPLRTIR